MHHYLAAALELRISTKAYSIVIGYITNCKKIK